jgi:hypothetical protein
MGTHKHTQRDDLISLLFSLREEGRLKIALLHIVLFYLYADFEIYVDQHIIVRT